MRPFFIWSHEGDALFLALRLKDNGADVTLHICEPRAQAIGRGLVKRSERVPKDAVVIFDAVGHGKEGRQMRMLGHPTINGHAVSEALEVNRTSGMRIMAECGIAIPETHPFSTCEQAIKFLKDQDGTWYFKCSGDLGTDMTEHGDPDLMTRNLRWWAKQPGEHPPFELQRGIDGIEVSCEGWWDGHRFVPPFNATLEDKKFMTGDKGPRTGCEANLVWAGARGLAKAGVGLVEPFLRKQRVTPGLIDLNTIVTAAGVPTGLEWTAFRLGFDALQAYTRLFGGSLPDQLEAFALGQLDELHVDEDEAALTLRLSVPPYPVDAPKAARETRGRPLDKALLHDDRFALTDVMLDADGLPASAGRDGHVATVGQVGTDLPALRRELLEVAEGLHISKLQHRMDPAEGYEDEIQALEAHGYVGHKALVAATAPPIEGGKT